MFCCQFIRFLKYNYFLYLKNIREYYTRKQNLILNWNAKINPISNKT